MILGLKNLERAKLAHSPLLFNKKSTTKSLIFLIWYTAIDEVRNLIIDDLLEGKKVNFVYEMSLLGVLI